LSHQPSAWRSSARLRPCLVEVDSMAVVCAAAQRASSPHVFCLLGGAAGRQWGSLITWCRDILSSLMSARFSLYARALRRRPNSRSCRANAAGSSFMLLGGFFFVFGCARRPSQRRDAQAAEAQRQRSLLRLCGSDVVAALVAARMEASARAVAAGFRILFFFVHDQDTGRSLVLFVRFRVSRVSRCAPRRLDEPDRCRSQRGIPPDPAFAECSLVVIQQRVLPRARPPARSRARVLRGPHRGPVVGFLSSVVKD